MLHYVLRQTAFADLLPACSADGHCYIKNDSPEQWQGTVNITALHLDTGELEHVSSTPVSLEAGAGVLQAFCASGNGDCQALDQLLPQCYQSPEQQDRDATTESSPLAACMLVLDAISSKSGEVATHNVLALAPPKSMALPNNVTVTTKVAATQHGDVVVVMEATGGVALYVVATTTLAGRFSDNAIFLRPGSPTTISFMPFGELAESSSTDLAKELAGSLRVEHLAQHCC